MRTPEPTMIPLITELEQYLESVTLAPGIHTMTITKVRDIGNGAINLTLATDDGYEVLQYIRVAGDAEHKIERRDAVRLISLQRALGCGSEPMTAASLEGKRVKAEVSRYQDGDGFPVADVKRFYAAN